MAVAEALASMIENEELAAAVAANGAEALGAYELTDDEAADLVADAPSLTAETAGFAAPALRSFGRVSADIVNVGPVAGPKLAGAIGRFPGAAAACGEHGCCSWESGLK